MKEESKISPPSLRGANSRHRLSELKNKERLLHEAFKIDQFYTDGRLDLAGLKRKLSQAKNSSLVNPQERNPSSNSLANPESEGKDFILLHKELQRMNRRPYEARSCIKSERFSSHGITNRVRFNKKRVMNTSYSKISNHDADTTKRSGASLYNNSKQLQAEYQEFEINEAPKIQNIGGRQSTICSRRRHLLQDKG
jgi:hypothetical protein